MYFESASKPGIDRNPGRRRNARVWLIGALFVLGAALILIVPLFTIVPALLNVPPARFADVIPAPLVMAAPVLLLKVPPLL